MITKEDIDKAAESYEDGLIYSSIKDQCDIQKAFKEGANWRINSIWHDAKEDPKEKEMLVVIDKDGDITQNDFMIDEFVGYDRWSDYVQDVGIVRWCYRKDLIPNKEE